MATLKLPVDIAKTQANFKSLIYIASIFQIIITISKQVSNKNHRLQISNAKSTS
jgi:hypothetical protein